jgi:hypothetical protein
VTLKDEYYEHRSPGDLVSAAEVGDQSAAKALLHALKLRDDQRPFVVERHPRHGWRVREPFARPGETHD